MYNEAAPSSFDCAVPLGGRGEPRAEKKTVADVKVEERRVKSGEEKRTKLDVSFDDQMGIPERGGGGVTVFLIGDPSLVSLCVSDLTTPVIDIKQNKKI